MSRGQHEVETDVLVVGAGACGLIAAIKAAQEGASVAILEKIDRFAGDTTLSTGTIPATGTRLQREAGISDSVERMIEDIDRISGPHDVPHLTRMLVERSAEVVEWLADHCGIPFKLYTNYRHIGHTVARLHLPLSGKGIDLLHGLAQAATRAGVDVAYATPVRRLLSDEDGAVTGAEAESAGGRFRVVASKTILATGGFGAKKALLREFCPAVAEAPFFGARSSEGDAIDWGRALGAQLANIGAYQAHASVAYPQRHLLTWSAAEKGAFYVTRSGRRIGNENAGYARFGGLVLAHGNEAYAIYDSRIRDYIGVHLPTYRNLVEMGGAREAPTIEALAAIHDIDAAQLTETLDRFNRAASGVEPDEFGRSDFGMAPLEPPYVVTRVQACLFHTQGGLLVDTKARVLRSDGSAIANLFAGGGAAACVSGREGGAGYVSGNGLLSASVLGYVAGETAARELKQDRKGRPKPVP